MFMMCGEVKAQHKRVQPKKNHDSVQKQYSDKYILGNMIE
ncbi:hypothetical protein JCM12296A_11460 [Desulfosarcina cetonica]